MNELILFLDGKRCDFFTATVTFSIEALAHTFSCTVPPIAITAPVKAEFKLNDKLIFTGIVDSTTTSHGAGQRSQSITGRSKSAHLIDSRIKMDAIYNQTFDSLLKSIVKDFGLTVTNNVASSMPLVPEFQINAESPLQNLAQIAKQQGFVLHEQTGTINIEKPGQFKRSSIFLEAGKNLLDVSIQRNWSALFHHYEIQGAWDGAEAIATYEPANQCRKKVIIADKLQDTQSCKARAEYERDLSLAKSLTVSGKVPGLHQELTGKILNNIILVKSPQDNFSEDLLVKTITLSVTEQEQSTSIQLFRPFTEVAKNV